MASTQTLTELPSIHYTGVDYNSVISQIREIIENNSNWQSNWTQFYNSEAGTMLIQLVAWICDTLGVRQDLLYNEMFMSTATTDKSRRRLLNLVGYIRKSASAAIVPISLEFDTTQNNVINLSNCRENENDLSSVVYNIYKFYGKDINGASRSFEILSINTNGTINYTKSVKLNSGKAYYTRDADGNQLKAVEGSTKYRTFTSDVSDGPYFVLEDDNIDLKTLQIYDITDNKNILHKKVNSFLDLNVLNGNSICYTVSVNDDGYYQINYPTKDIVTYGSSVLEDRLFTPGNTIGVFYRTTSGSVGNITANYISTEDTVTDSEGNIVDVTIKNILAGFDGADAEPLSSAVKNSPQVIKTMNRGVTINDYDLLLKQNDLVLNCKSYSPDNMPQKFISYYGRRINPQEIFSFIILNKNFGNIPSDKLNYYPWIELNQNPVLNEKYVFGGAKLNDPKLADFTGALNIYINNSLEKIKGFNFSGDPGDTMTDDGSKYYKHYNFTAIQNGEEKQFKARQLSNLTLYKTNNVFGEYIKNELTNLNNNIANSTYLSIKIHNNETAENYVKNINNSFLNTTDNLTTENNILEANVSASYTGTNIFSSTVDFINYKYLRFVLDDNLVLTVDFQKEMAALGNAEEYGQDPSEYTSYYLHFFNSDQAVQEKLDTLKKYFEDNNESVRKSYYNSMDFADYRKGIVQLISEQIKEQIDYLGIPVEINVDNVKKGKLINTYKNTKLYYYDKKYYVMDSKNNVYSTSVADNNISPSFSVIKRAGQILVDNAQKFILRNKLADGSSAFVDLGLQQSSYEGGDYLKLSYKNTIDQSQSNYGVDDLHKYYRIKINGEIYALRIDASTAAKAIEFYTDNSSRINGVVNYYDYFPYIGAGVLKDSVNHSEIFAKNENDNAWGVLLAKYPGQFSYENLRSSVFTTGSEKNGMIKYNGNGSDTITYVSFTIEQLAVIIEYLISVFNLDTDTVYRYIDGAWYDIKDTTVSKPNEFKGDEFSYRNVLDGKLRATCVEKANFENAECLNLPIESSNNYPSGIEYDIRFEYFNGNEALNISSVSESEIFDNTTAASDDTVPINGEQTIDLIQGIFSSDNYLGQRRQYKAEAINYRDADIEDIFNYTFATSDADSGFINFKSLASGEGSSIYFIRTADSDNKEFIKYSGLLNGFKYSNNTNLDGYNEKARSEKAIGIKRLELYTGNGDNEDDGIIAMYGSSSETLKAAFPDKNFENNETVSSISVGDILITDSDINHVGIGSLYFSYILEGSTTLLLNKQNNFYYDSDEEINEAAKPDIVSIEGAAVSTDAEGNYYIDNDKSNFKLKITADEQETNSYFAINEDTLEDLGVLKNDKVFVETDNIIGGTNFQKYSFDAIGVKKLSEIAETLGDYEIPLIYSFDKYTSNCPEDGIAFDYAQYTNNVIAINPGSLKNISGADIFSKISSKMQVSSDEILSKNYNSLLKQAKNSTNKLVFSGITNSSDGNITFYYPSTANALLYILPSAIDQPNDPDAYLAATRAFYLHLFGTNKTNPDFYNLYPKDVMTNKNYGLNSIDVIQNVGDDEYFYCPVPNHHLKFVYRNYLDSSKSTSKFGDYYISATGSNFTTGYNFYLNKTPWASFPDSEFYVHFVNDRTYEYKRTSGSYQTEEDIIDEYMTDYRITGMETHLLKPYFKPFDITAIVNYNANYDMITIRTNVENALTSKYAITNINNFGISTSIYRSDIFKTILDIEGVESVQIQYFGYNCKDKGNYPDQKYILTSGDGDSSTTDDFYIIPVLHDTKNGRGLNMTYVRVNTTTTNLG